MEEMKERQREKENKDRELSMAEFQKQQRRLTLGTISPAQNDRKSMASPSSPYRAQEFSTKLIDERLKEFDSKMQRGKERNTSYMAQLSRAAQETTAKHSNKLFSVRENQERHEDSLIQNFIKKAHQEEKRLLKFHKTKEASLQLGQGKQLTRAQEAFERARASDKECKYNAKS